MGDLEQIILFAVLDLGDDACGVEIRDAIEARTGRAVSSGAIYTTLGRLETRGLVSAALGARAQGRPGRPRKHYALTPAGARALMHAYRTLRSMAGDQIPKLTDLAEG